MKMIKLFFVIMLVVSSFFVGESFAVVYQRPVGFVNDFANKIDDTSERKIEQQLSNYEKATSIEMTIVLPKTLDGHEIEEWTMGLAEQWKVGKKGKDNGLIIVIATKERKWRIEVGRGLEGDITDLVAGRLGDNVLVPFLKKENYVDGVSALVDATIKILGQYSAADRALMMQEKAEAERIAKEKTKENVIIVVLILVVLTALFFFVIFIRSLIKKIRERGRIETLKNHLQEQALQLESVLHEKEKTLQEIKIDRASLPVWSEEKCKTLSEVVSRKISQGKKELADIEGMITSNPDMTKELLDNIRATLDQIDDNTEKVRFLPQEVEQVNKDAHVSVKNLTRSLTNAIKEVEEVCQSGIEVDSSRAQLQELQKRWNVLHATYQKNGIGRDDLSLEIDLGAKEIATEVQKVIQTVSSLSEKREKVRMFLTQSSEKVQSLRSGILVHQNMLQKMQEMYPEKVWKEVAEEYTRSESLIANLSKLILMVTGILLVKESDILSATAKITEAEELCETIASLQSNVFSLNDKIKNAQSEVEKNMISAVEKVSEAEHFISESDVGANAKSIIREAADGLRSAQAHVEQKMVDWIALAIIVQTVILTAEEAVKKAKEDINSAENAAQKAQSNNSSSGVTNISSDTNFNGFGGGNFGGGGASGSW